MYFPHGIGDWAQFSYILPLLEPSNRYWMTRYGDEFVALIDDCPLVCPGYSGINSADNDFGGAFGNRHFGIGGAALDGRVRQVNLPGPLFELCRSQQIDAMLCEGFPETRGGVAYPFHSKARNALRHLVPPQRLATFDLEKPLQSPLSFKVGASVRAWVEARLRDAIGMTNRKVCLVARNGYTSTDKNWGHAFRQDLPPPERREGQECRDFMRLLREKDDRWAFVVIEDRLFEGDDTVRSRDLQAYSYAELFGSVDQATIPFGLVIKVLASIADLCVGVPTGPFHICMAKVDLPTIGIWIQHLPSWYDEPKVASIHIIGRTLRRQLGRQPGSFCTTAGLEFRTILVETRIVRAEPVLAAVEALL